MTIEDYEEKGIENLKSIFPETYTITRTEPLSHYDATITTPTGKTYKVENKIRKFPSWKYSTSYIDVGKAEGDRADYFFVWYSDGKYYYISIDELVKFPTTKIIGKKTTFEDNGVAIKINYEVPLTDMRPKGGGKYK